MKLHKFFQSKKYFEEGIKEIISFINNGENLTAEYLNIENDLPNEIIISGSFLMDPLDKLYFKSKAQAIIGSNSSLSLWAGFSVNSRDGNCIFPKSWFGSDDLRDKSPVPTDFVRF